MELSRILLLVAAGGALKTQLSCQSVPSGPQKLSSLLRELNVTSPIPKWNVNHADGHVEFFMSEGPKPKMTYLIKEDIKKIDVYKAFESSLKSKGNVEVFIDLIGHVICFTDQHHMYILGSSSDLINEMFSFAKVNSTDEVLEGFESLSENSISVPFYYNSTMMKEQNVNLPELKERSQKFINLILLDMSIFTIKNIGFYNPQLPHSEVKKLEGALKKLEGYYKEVESGNKKFISFSGEQDIAVLFAGMDDMNVKLTNIGKKIAMLSLLK